MFTASKREGDVATIVVECEDPPSEPIAPAWLVEVDTDSTVIELHKLTDRQLSSLVFETYGQIEHQPIIGRAYGLRSMWSPGTLEIVVDRERAWTRERYPTGGDDCVYCPLTWLWFGRGTSRDSTMEGYRSGEVWITVDAYERFIRDDMLRVRGLRT